MDRAVDFIGDPHATVSYGMVCRNSAGQESRRSPVATAYTHPMSDDELLTMVQEASFQYYWDGAEPNSGMARESIPGDPEMIAVGGSGFGIMSLIVGAERGFAPREAIVRAHAAHHRLSCTCGPLSWRVAALSEWKHRPHPCRRLDVRRRRGYRRDIVPDGGSARGARILHPRHSARSASCGMRLPIFGGAWSGTGSMRRRSTMRSIGIGHRTSDFTRRIAWRMERNAHALSSRHRVTDSPSSAQPVLHRLGSEGECCAALRQTSSCTASHSSRRSERNDRAAVLHCTTRSWAMIRAAFATNTLTTS